MTVIASFVVNGCPVIIGDLLISGTTDSEHTIHLPTIGSIENIFTEGCEYVPTGLLQKVVVIDENLVIAWAGSVVGAKTALSEIKLAHSRNRFTPDSLWQFIQEMENDPDYDEIALICMIGDGDKIDRFGLRATYLTLGSFEEIFVAGSGSERFLRSLNQMNNKDLTKLDQTAAAIAVAMNIFGFLLFDEMAPPSEHGLHSLFEYFGSGYEIATFIERKITKIDDIIFTFWLAEIVDEGAMLRLPPLRMYKYYYIDDCLYLYSLTLSIKSLSVDQSIPDEFDMKKEIYIINSLSGRPVKVDNIHEPELRAKWNVSYVWLTKKDGTVQGVSRFDYRPDRDSPIKIKEDGIELNKEMVDDLMSSLYLYK